MIEAILGFIVGCWMITIGIWIAQLVSTLSLGLAMAIFAGIINLFSGNK